MIERELIEEIRMSNDIVGVVSGYVRLKRSGSTMSGLCPFHNEKTPSFHVSEDKQIFRCFGCGASGNVITFVMRIENYEFLDAVNFLAERAGIIIEHRTTSEQAKLLQEKKAAIYEINKKAARFFYETLKGEAGAEAVRYINGRGLSRAIQIKCGLGYSPKSPPSLYGKLKSEGYSDSILLEAGLISKSKSGSGYYDKFFDRLMFPIFDISGKIVGFGGRVLGDGMPKYLNSPETPVFEKGRLLYGMNFARGAKKREIIVVEGYMDVIALYQAGFMNAVASLGTAFTPHHAKLLKNYADSVIMLYDSDDAGTKAVYKALPHLLKVDLSIKVVQTPDAKDPDDYIKKFGREQFARLLDSAKSHIAFQIDNERSKYDDLAQNIDQKVTFTKEVSKILATVQSAIERDAYIKETAALTGISESAIRQEAEPSVSEPAFTNKARAVPYREQALPKKLTDAQEWLLGLIASNESAFYRTVQYISEIEFTSPLYSRLYGIINEFYNQKKPIHSAELTSYFETVDEQQSVAKILSTYNMPESTPEVEKDLNDQLRAIKAYEIDGKIRKFSEGNDEKALQTALNEQKAVKRLYISLRDG